MCFFAPSPQYQYKKNYEKSKGHYHTIPDNLEQLHLKEATELQSIVKYKEKYEKERGKPMLDFETPTYITAKESQQMQSGVSPTPHNNDIIRPKSTGSAPDPSQPPRTLPESGRRYSL